MASQAFRFTVSSAIVFLATMFTSPFAYAQVSGGGDVPKATSGLGESIPDAVDLANDPAWQVYEFERDGVRYVQVNDLSGTVRAAAGRIGSTFWVMPIGADADRVTVPGDALPAGNPRVLYRGADVEVVLYQDGDRQRWLVQPLAATQ